MARLVKHWHRGLCRAERSTAKLCLNLFIFISSIQRSNHTITVFSKGELTPGRTLEMFSSSWRNWRINCSHERRTLEWQRRKSWQHQKLQSEHRLHQNQTKENNRLSYEAFLWKHSRNLNCRRCIIQISWTRSFLYLLSKCDAVMSKMSRNPGQH